MSYVIDVKIAFSIFPDEQISVFQHIRRSKEAQIERGKGYKK